MKTKREKVPRDPLASVWNRIERLSLNELLFVVQVVNARIQGFVNDYRDATFICAMPKKKRASKATNQRGPKRTTN